MSAVVSNLCKGRRLRVLSPLLPALALPLALAGVTVPRATGLGDAAQEVAWARERAERADRTRAELLRLGEHSQVADLEAAAAALRDLVPAPQPELELFNRLRLLGDVLQLHLTQTDLLPPVDLGAEVDGESVHMREVRYVGVAPLSHIVEAVHELRRQGTPVTVLDVALSRSAGAVPEFDFSLRLGLFHRAPSATQQGAAPSAALQSDH